MRTECLGLAVGGACLLPLLLGSSSHVHTCHPAVIYMLIGFAGCSVGRGINRGACKLARTPRRSKKKSMHQCMSLLVVAVEVKPVGFLQEQCL
jgi:hypothetical protein